MGKFGRFQLEAAIESVHIDRKRSGNTDWASLTLLYEGLLRLAHSVGAAVARAVAVGHAQGSMQGLMALEQIPEDMRARFQPAWVAKAHLLEMGGDFVMALKAIDSAIALTIDTKLKEYLLKRRSELHSRCNFPSPKP
jgi:predicted RNA polymerase sigma factor